MLGLGNAEVTFYYRRMMTRNDIEQLFRSNYPAMLTLANRLIHDSEVARDIVHEQFASLLTNSPDKVSPAFLLQGVRYACLNYIRKISMRNRINRLYALDFKEIEDEEWPDEEDIALLNSIIDNKLSEQSRRVIKLRFNSRLSYREISEKLNISEAAVYKHLRHALNVLRQNFNGNER